MSEFHQNLAMTCSLSLWLRVPPQFL